MAKLYLDSNKVNVYPTALRGTGIDLSASLNTEFNITNAITRLCDKDCFVVSGPETVSGEKVFIVSLSGYWFRLVFPASALSNSIYVGIQLGDHHFTTLDTLMLTNIAQGTETILDNSGTFEGLVYSSVESDLVDRDGNDLSIKLQIWDGTNQEVPEASWIRIDSNRVGDKYSPLEKASRNLRSGLTTDNLMVTAEGDIILGVEDGTPVDLDFTGVTGDVIHPAIVYIDGSDAEADWRSADGKRKFISGTIDSGSSTAVFTGNPQEYQKIHAAYTDGVLTLKFND